jgi:hypothetical protein
MKVGFAQAKETQWPTLLQAWLLLLLSAQRHAQTLPSLLGGASTALGQLLEATVAAAGWKQVQLRTQSLNWWQVPLPLLISAGIDGG